MQHAARGPREVSSTAPPVDLEQKMLILDYKMIEDTALFGRCDGISPFGDDGVALVHGHAGVLGEHNRTTTPSPRDEIDEMFFAEGCGPAWRVSRHGTALN